MPFNQWKKESNNTSKVVVLSIQTLGKEIVAYTQEQVAQVVKENTSKFEGVKNGNTGITLAAALKSPFVVFCNDNDKENESANSLLKDNIGNNGLIVLTGHGQQKKKFLEGNYVDKPVKRDIKEIVKKIVNAGLKPGDHITIMLMACHAAFGEKESFAQALSKEFADNKISTTIIGSTIGVKRFGMKALQNNCISFDGSVGMEKDYVRVVKTRFQDEQFNFTTIEEAPEQQIKISEKGLHFTNKNKTKNEDLKQFGASKLLVIDAINQINSIVREADLIRLIGDKSKKDAQLKKIADIKNRSDILQALEKLQGDDNGFWGYINSSSEKINSLSEQQLKTFNDSIERIQQKFKKDISVLSLNLVKLKVNNLQKIEDKDIKTLSENLLSLQENLFKKLTINSTVTDLNEALTAFNKDCLKHVDVANKIMGHGWLYKSIEIVIKAILAVFAGIGMSLGMIVGRGWLNAEDRKSFKNQFCLFNQTPANKQIESFEKEREKLNNDLENMSLFSKI